MANRGDKGSTNLRQWAQWFDPLISVRMQETYAITCPVPCIALTSHVFPKVSGASHQRLHTWNIWDVF